MSAAEQVPIERLREIFAFDPETGALTWKERLSAYTVIGGSAGYTCDHGYTIVQFLRCKARVHRLGWALHFGAWPSAELDHINGDRQDNRIANLRLSDDRSNARNRRRAHSQNSTGLLGVHKRGTKFTSAICTNGKQRFLGVFGTKEEAHSAYLSAKRLEHGEVFA